MNQYLISKFIALPIAISNLKQDKEHFASFKFGDVYIAKLDAVIKEMEKDFYKLKSELITKHHIEIRKIDRYSYSVNGEVIEYTPDQLKDMTEQVMKKYFNKDVNFNTDNKPWTDM